MRQYTAFDTPSRLPALAQPASLLLPASFGRGQNNFVGLFGSDPGDSIRSARNIGTLRRGSSFRRSGEVGGSDLDFFKFKVDRRTNFTARLTNEDADPDAIAITILNRRGQAVSLNSKPLFRNVEAGETGVISVSGLPRGEYYVRLQSERGRDQDYALELSTTRSTDSNNGNNGNNGNSPDSRDLGRLDRDRRYDFSGTVGNTDTDFYRFSLDDRSRFSSELFNNSDDAIAISLLNANNQVVQTDNGRFLFGNVEPNRSLSLFAPTLPRGSYAIRIQSAVGTRERYNLSVRRSALSITPI